MHVWPWRIVVGSSSKVIHHVFCQLTSSYPELLGAHQGDLYLNSSFSRGLMGTILPHHNGRTLVYLDYGTHWRCQGKGRKGWIPTTICSSKINVFCSLLPMKVRREKYPLTAEIWFQNWEAEWKFMQVLGVGGEMILKEMPCQAAVEECQVPSKIAKEVDDERQRDSSRKIAEIAEVRRVGRPARSTDVHNMHRGWSGRPARSTAMPDWQIPTLGFSGSTGPVDRKTLTDKPQLSGFLGRPTRSTGIRRSVDRTGRPTVGFWVKSADSLYEVF